MCFFASRGQVITCCALSPHLVTGKVTASWGWNKGLLQASARVWGASGEPPRALKEWVQHDLATGCVHLKGEAFTGLQYSSMQQSYSGVAQAATLYPSFMLPRHIISFRLLYWYHLIMINLQIIHIITIVAFKNSRIIREITSLTIPYHLLHLI